MTCYPRRVSRVRRFVLVATATAGALLLATAPLDSPYGRWYPLLGLAVAIASAATAWAPRVAATTLGRIVLAGFMSIGLLGFASLAFRDLHDMGVARGTSTVWVFVVGWLVASGVVGQLAITGTRPRHIYLGMSLAMSAIVPFARSTRASLGSVIVGIWIMALLSLICAAITAAIQRRVAARRDSELPGARVIS